jgi:hypothetical protein
MNTLRTLATLLAFAAIVTAQQQFDLPTFNPIPTSNNYPFAGPKMRYQLWYSAAEWRARLRDAVRVCGIQFKAGSPGGQTGKQIDVEVTMANSSPVQAVGSFDQNLVSARTVVVPRTRVQLATATPGSYPVRFTFSREFLWDGVSGVAVDIRIFDNGNLNQPYQYDLEATVSSGTRITRLFTVDDPNSTTAAVIRPGEGLTTRFLYSTAITVPFGQGCPGAGGFVPVAGTSGGWPIPGNTAWTPTLTNAPSQRAATFAIGASNTMWAGTIPLPHELVEIRAFGCFLLVDPVATAGTMTVGGGPGAGQTSFNLPIPPITTINGVSFYSQWLVLDPGATNGVLTASQGLKHVVGPR